VIEDDIPTLAWEKSGGLIPAVVQDADTLQVLMVAWMDEAALRETLASGEATFFSRSRAGRWRKGETSGDRLQVVSVTADCDRDTLLVLARPLGPACHLKTTSCFGPEDAPGLGRLARLEQTIASRAAADPETSYVARLLAEGPLKCAQKVGEEGVETALAGAAQDDVALLEESADLLFHLLVLLRSRGLEVAQTLAILQARANNG
jgi:phosphoribosyl-ATP pyrophosphohydrolase/phosphoribosyl-AMP cyclohydrolase